LENWKKISSIVERILKVEKNEFAELFNACDELYSTLISTSGINPDEPVNSQNLSLPEGQSLGLTWAALCIKDIARTKRFYDGILKAFNEKRKDSKPVHVLYTGTGPFAALILPLMSRYSASEVRFTLLEANKVSFSYLKQFINENGLKEYIHNIENADATNWKIPENEKVDIFICEAMQKGLQKEPQVAICRNIVPQLQNESMMIPQQIKLKAAMINPDTRMKSKFEDEPNDNGIKEMAEVLIIDKNILRESYLPEAQINISADIAKGYPELSILTEITVYENEKLMLDESALTLPLTLTTITHASNVKFQYKLGHEPRIIFEKN